MTALRFILEDEKRGMSSDFKEEKKSRSKVMPGPEPQKF